jgi:adenylate cyclase
MPTETERKFLVDQAKWAALDKPQCRFIRQGYLLISPERNIRVRLKEGEAFLTIKGPLDGASRSEFEYEIPEDEARELLDHLCVSELSKHRYVIPCGGFDWEVDEFLGSNAGLVLAEIELPDETTAFDLPPWVGQEVTGDERYYNPYLSQNRFPGTC